MSFALTSFLKDIARWRQDRIAILIWVAIPLMIGGLITTMMGSGAKPRGTLLLVDEDQTFLSELVVGAYGSGELGELISVEKVGYDDGLERINDGEASALLVIPDGFADAFLESEPVTLKLRTNPSQFVLPGIIVDVTEILLDAGFYAHQLFGDELDSIVSLEEDPGEAFVAAMAVGIQRKIETVAPRLFPPAFDIEIVEPPPKEPSPPLALLFLPGIILMTVMFAANDLAGDFWRERDQGTLRRLVLAPGQLGPFIAGKALAAALMIGLVSGITLILGLLYHDLPWIKLPSSLAWIAVSGVAISAWFAALQMFFSSRRSANIATSVLVFPLLMLGGSFFPMAVMPGWMAAVGRVSPNGFVADRLTAELAGSGVWLIDAGSWLLVIAAALTGLALCAWRLRAGFARA
jgi:ABC-type Na+ efflux pump permease subunit